MNFAYVALAGIIGFGIGGLLFLLQLYIVSFICMQISGALIGIAVSNGFWKRIGLGVLVGFLGGILFVFIERMSGIGAGLLSKL